MLKNLSYRQIHLDFHTSEQIIGVGREFDAEEFAHTLREAAVNSITCFSKCHHGMIYHDTRFEAKHPHLERNLLKEQIDICHRYDIKVPVYISVGYDEFMAARHPEWIEIDRDGKRNGAGPLDAGWRKLCLNTQYVDYVLAQTEEVLDLFDVDGLFFDISTQGQCCCRQCIEDMIRKRYDPEQESDRLRFSSEVVSAFKERMSSVIRAKKQNCRIFCNAGHVGPYIRPNLSAYTHLELESLPSGGWGYEHFPVTARYARNLGLEFLGQTGKFLKSWADFGGFKNPAGLEYECFRSLALCGGCGIGDQLHPSGRTTAATYDLIGSVYRQVAKKEPWCIGAGAITEIGAITPEVVPLVPDPLNDAASGVYRMLKERHYLHDFIDFEMDLTNYKVIILPDLIRLNHQQAGMLNSFVAGGGRLLVSYHSGMGTAGCDFLLENMPVVVMGDAEFSPDYLVAERAFADGIPASEHAMYERGLKLDAADGARVLASVWKPYFERNYRHFCSHFHTPVECPAGYPGIVANDKIAYIGYPIFGMYKRHGARVYREMALNSLKLLLPDEEKLVLTNAPTTADITLNYQSVEDRYVLHILHYIPERRFNSTDTIEDIIPLHNVDVDLLLPPGYEKAHFVPQEEAIETSRVGGRLHLVIPEVHGHVIVSIDRW